MPTPSPNPPRPSFGEMTGAFARIGIVSFGGPAGQIALMHRVLVEEKGWLDEPRFLRALNYCMLLPGPEAMQLAAYCGWLLHGTRGGVAAGLLFLAPGAMAIVALSVVYLALGDAPVVAGLLFGLKAAVLALVLEALVRLSRRVLKGGFAAAVAIAAFVAIALLNVPFPLVVLGAALAGALRHVLPRYGRSRPGAGGAGAEAVAGMPEWARPGGRRFLAAALTWLAVWLGPLALLLAVLGPRDVFAVQAVFFSIVAAVTFGGAYAVLAYVAQQAVEIYGWLRPEEMLTGLGLAESTPGPLILVLAFVGFLGGARLSGLEPFLGGLAGALVALWFTFVPSFMWALVGAPYVETLHRVGWLGAALEGVTAAVVGVIANLALWFALHVLFADVGTWWLGPLALPLPVPESFDVAAGAIALAAGIALMLLRANMFAVLGAAALAGAAVSTLAG